MLPNELSLADGAGYPGCMMQQQDVTTLDPGAQRPIKGNRVLMHSKARRGRHLQLAITVGD